MENRISFIQLTLRRAPFGDLFMDDSNESEYPAAS